MENLLNLGTKQMQELLNKPEIKEMIKKIVNEENTCSLQEQYIEQEFPLSIKENISKDTLEQLKDDDTFIQTTCTLNLKKVREGKELLYELRIENKTYTIQLMLTPTYEKKFRKTFEDSSDIWCTGVLSFSDRLQQYILSNIKVYTIKEPFKVYYQKLESQSLNERINNFISLLGLNPSKLLLFEKKVMISRIIPLIAKKHLYLELSKKEIGKSYTYEQLDFKLNTLNVTRATTFIDGRDGKLGDFFSEKVAFIVDEVNKITDSEFFTSIQTYMNNASDVGKIQSTKSNQSSSNSIILLGNIKENINYSLIYSMGIDILDNMSIPFNNKSAFLSRVSALLPSWGCRTFSQEMVDSNNNELYNRLLLKKIIPLLREKTVDINLLLQRVNYSLEAIATSTRVQKNISKNFEALIKLLYPSILENNYVISNEEILFLIEWSIELLKGVNFYIKKYENNHSDGLMILNSQMRIIGTEYYKNNNVCTYVTPHRIFTLDKANDFITKIPLDFIGLQMNKSEAKLMATYNIGFSFDNIKLTHSKNNFFKRASYCVNYNFLTGEFENYNYGADNDILAQNSFFLAEHL